MMPRADPKKPAAATRIEQSPGRRPGTDSGHDRFQLKPARGPAPRIEHHVACDDGRGQHHAEFWSCQQKNGGERVEEGSTPSSMRRQTGAFPRSPSSARVRTECERG